MIRFIRKVLILFLIFLVVLSMIFYIFTKTDSNISKVDVVSNDGLVYISKQSLINEISSLSYKKEWFDIDVNNIENYLYSIQGVDYTLVKKIWPSTLVIYLYDQKPIAYWNNNQILLENMDIITPEVFSYDEELPYIVSSDKANKDYIYETYHNLDEVAEQNSMKVLRIFYKGNQFSVLLSNDLLVVLGSKKLESRLKLFFESYKKVKNYKSIKYFDMRYSDGFAVKY